MDGIAAFTLPAIAFDASGAAALDGLAATSSGSGIRINVSVVGRTSAFETRVDVWPPPGSGNAPAHASFADTDGRAGVLSGRLAWNAAPDETHFTGYEVYLMNGTSVGSLVYATPKDLSGSYYYDFEDYATGGASGIGIYAKGLSGRLPDGAILHNVDLALPPVTPLPVLPTAQAASFLDADARGGYVAGALRWTAASDESGIGGYAVWFVNGQGDRIGTELGRVAQGRTSYALPVKSSMPVGAVGLAIVSLTKEGGLSASAATALSTDQTSAEGVKAALKHALFPNDAAPTVRDVVAVLTRREDVTGDGVYGKEDARLVLSLLG